tara:strand:+ start:496 stop:756 length:261 start_codon:yes stop_codon:yes gene_type:complete
MSYIIVKGENEEVVNDSAISGVFSSHSAAEMRLSAFRNELWSKAMREAARLTSVVRGHGREKLWNLIFETRNEVEDYRLKFIQPRD